MPITRIPVVHKFGIISHNQRLELQQRLIRKTYEESHLTNRSIAESKRNPLEVSDAFVKAFNEAETYTEKQKLEGTAEVMLERLKRKAGVRAGGTSIIEELDSAWTDLAALLQCHGRIQEEALDVLTATLHQAPLEPLLVPGIFFLAETVLYWLRTEAMQSPYLRTWEIKLLKIGYMVFMRLYYYHMVGYLQSCRPFKNRLYAYLQGLPGYQSVYSAYPNAHLFLRYIIEVGNILLSDDDLDPGDLKESDLEPLPKSSGKPADAIRSTTDSAVALGATAAAPGTGARDTDFGKNDDVLITLSHSVHDLAPTLWHSLDVWRCCYQSTDEIGTALKAVLKCGAGLHAESWIDTGCALIVLGEAAKLRLDVLKALQRLAQGHDQAIKPLPVAAIDEHETTQKDNTPVHCPGDLTYPDDAEADGSAITARASARSNANDTAVQPSLGTATVELEHRMEELTPVTYANSPVPTHASGGGLPGWRWEVSCIYSETLCSIVLHGATSSIQKRALMGNHSHVDSVRLHDTLHDSAGLVDLLVFNPSASRELRPQGEELASDEPVLLAGEQTGSAPSGVLHLPETDFAKEELLNQISDGTAPRQPQANVSQSLGSEPQLQFASHKQLVDEDPEDWTWRIRYSAVQSLVHICQCLRDDEVRSGLRQAAFSALLRAQNYFERDSRVLEALKVGQASAKIEDTLQGKMTRVPSLTRKLADEKSGAAMRTAAEPKDSVGMPTVGAKIAAALSERYLPPLQLSSRRQPPVSGRSPSNGLPSARQQRPQPGTKGPKPATKKPAAPLRTTIKEELAFSASGAAHLDVPDFNTRTSMDLRRIVEDQWRKELHQQLQEEEAERLRQLDENRQNARSKPKGTQPDKQRRRPRSAAAAVASDAALSVPPATASVGTT